MPSVIKKAASAIRNNAPKKQEEMLRQVEAMWGSEEANYDFELAD